MAKWCPPRPVEWRKNGNVVSSVSLIHFLGSVNFFANSELNRPPIRFLHTLWVINLWVEVHMEYIAFGSELSANLHYLGGVVVVMVQIFFDTNTVFYFPLSTSDWLTVIIITETSPVNYNCMMIWVYSIGTGKHWKIRIVKWAGPLCDNWVWSGEFLVLPCLHQVPLFRTNAYFVSDNTVDRCFVWSTDHFADREALFHW